MTISAEAPAQIVPTGAGPTKAGGGIPWTQRKGWLSQHLGTAIIGAIAGYVIGHWFGNYLSSGYTYIANSG